MCVCHIECDKAFYKWSKGISYKKGGDQNVLTSSVSAPEPASGTINTVIHEVKFTT